MSKKMNIRIFKTNVLICCVDHLSFTVLSRCINSHSKVIYFSLEKTCKTSPRGCSQGTCLPRTKVLALLVLKYLLLPGVYQCSFEKTSSPRAAPASQSRAKRCARWQRSTSTSGIASHMTPRSTSTSSKTGANGRYSLIINLLLNLIALLPRA